MNKELTLGELMTNLAEGLFTPTKGSVTKENHDSNLNYLGKNIKDKLFEKHNTLKRLKLQNRQAFKI